MEIICAPNLSEEEIDKYQERINNAHSSEIIVVPFDCKVVRVEQDNHCTS